MKCQWCDEEIPEDAVFCPECGVELNPSSTGVAEEEQVADQVETMKCLRCPGQMNSLGINKIQLGEYGFFLGDLSNLLSGALEVEIFQCNQCGKIEFFAADFTKER